MKTFFSTFLVYLLPLLVLAEIIGLVVPSDIPYGVVIVSKLLLAIVGSIISIAVLRKKHSLVSFGNSFLAGFTVLVIGLVISVIVYMQFHEAAYYVTAAEAFLALSIFTFAQMFLLLAVLLAAGMWYVYEKAGQKGYATIIPIYNMIALLKIAEKPVWWIIFMFIPVVNIVFIIMTLNGVSKNFGKDEGFTVGLIFLGAIFWSILGYGDARYKGNGVKEVQSNLLDSDF